MSEKNRIFIALTIVAVWRGGSKPQVLDDESFKDEPGAEDESEAQEFSELAAHLGFAGQLERPSAGLKTRLMASIAVPAGVHVLRLEPGARYPRRRHTRHRHTRPQQCLVLQGEVEIDAKLRIEAGDFEWADGDTIHDSISSTTGCELLIISSLHDEILV